MSVVDARLRVHHPCPYCDISVEFPRTLLLLWCDNRRDVFLVSSPTPAELREVLRALKDAFHARPLVVQGRDALVLVPDFEWEDPPSVTRLARKGDVWTVHPVVYFDGTETYRFLAPSRGRLLNFVRQVRKLGDVEILSLSDRSDLSALRDLHASPLHFFEGLTDRQARSLVAAYEGGLLDVPARSTWSRVARSEGLSRSTFGEHLRKGQYRLLENSYALLKARLEPRGESVLLPKVGEPRSPTRTPLQGTRDRPGTSSSGP